MWAKRGPAGEGWRPGRELCLHVVSRVFSPAGPRGGGGRARGHTVGVALCVGPTLMGWAVGNPSGPTMSSLVTFLVAECRAQKGPGRTGLSLRVGAARTHRPSTRWLGQSVLGSHRCCPASGSSPHDQHLGGQGFNLEGTQAFRPEQHLPHFPGEHQSPYMSVALLPGPPVSQGHGSASVGRGGTRLLVGA